MMFDSREKENPYLSSDSHGETMRMDEGNVRGDEMGGLSKTNRSGIMALLAVAGTFLLKFLKPLLISLKAFKAGAVLKTGLTMVLSMWAYALAWGWAYGIIFVLLILIHEMGHVYALREFGVRAGAPVFIPFMGAFVALKEMPKNVRIEAWTAIAGPIVGTGGAMLCWSAALYTGSSFWMAAAYTGFFLNLFNLIPISPLDGGRTVAAISPKLWILGFIGVLGMFFRSFNPILLIILFPAGRNVYELWKNRNERQKEYYKVDKKTRVQISLFYFALLVFLAIAMSLTHVKR
jgi:Zn-dependent protease